MSISAQHESALLASVPTGLLINGEWRGRRSPRFRAKLLARGRGEILRRAFELVTERAEDFAQGLKEPAQEAMENVKATAADAAAHVKDEGQTSVTDVKSSATGAKDHVQKHLTQTPRRRPPHRTGDGGRFSSLRREEVPL